VAKECIPFLLYDKRHHCFGILIGERRGPAKIVEAYCCESLGQDEQLLHDYGYRLIFVSLSISPGKTILHAMVINARAILSFNRRSAPEMTLRPAVTHCTRNSLSSR
jgi:hypothetical protein